MSSRPSTSRVSLEDWDTLAPLSSAESAHVAFIEQRAHEKPIPTRVPSVLPVLDTKLTTLVQLIPTIPITAASHNNSSNTTRPSTPQNHGGIVLPGSQQLARKSSRMDLSSLLLASPSSSSRPQSALASLPFFALSNPSDPALALAHPIETTQQFHDWFSLVSASLEREQEDVFRAHLALLATHLDSCDIVLAQLDDARGLLGEMEANYRFVEDNSRALQLACETMLEEQKHLIEVTEALGARLDYFRELESATRMLNLPGEKLVLEEDFLNMLDRLDGCLEYLRANRDFKDAEIYIVRFQQCLTRSMTLIKMYFLSIIRSLTIHASTLAQRDANISETALHALFYTKFEGAAEALKVLVVELEKRAKREKEEYGNLWAECWAGWTASRSQLIGPGLAEEVKRMESQGTDLIKFARAGCNHLRGVAMAEWSLARHFFSSGSSELYALLDTLSDHLFDSLRPRILHEPRLEVLCELCTVITAMMALDSSPGTESDSDSDAGGDSTPFDETVPSGQSDDLVGRLEFSRLLRPILQDVQTRLVFRAQAVMQAEVLYYSPLPVDLDYPAKLKGEAAGRGEGLALWTEDERLREGGDQGGFRLPRREVMESWWPTLRKTVWVLSKLNTYVNNAIFEDFAGEAVTLCRQSLGTASGLIAQREGNTALDGQLFLVRHLLLLKEMLRSVDLVHIERAADFSSVTDAFVNLLRNTSVIFNPNALFELASKGMPSFGETMTDAKTDLDNALKKTCETLITSSSTLIALPLRQFLDKCAAYLSSASTTSDLPNQSWALPAEVTRLHDEWVGKVESEVGVVRGKLEVWLRDGKTVGVLLPPLLDELVETYSTFYNLTRSEYDFATSSSLLTPAVVKERLIAAGPTTAA